MTKCEQDKYGLSHGLLANEKIVECQKCITHHHKSAQIVFSR